jgi:hypothetical protein
MVALWLAKLAMPDTTSHDPWDSPQGWRLNSNYHRQLRFDCDDQAFEVVLDYRRDGWRMAYQSQETILTRIAIDQTSVSLSIEGRRISGRVVRVDDRFHVFWQGQHRILSWSDPMAHAGEHESEGGRLTAPMPGKIVQLMVAEGASVERAVATGFDSQETLRWNLFTADFLTASRVRDAINVRFPGSATVEDGITLAMRLPLSTDARATMMASIEMIEVTPAETAARVIVNSRTGTVVINSAVRLSPAAISHGRLVVRIDEKPQVSQPAPLSRGQTAITPSSQITVEEPQAHVALFKPGASLSSLVDALNKLGVTPSDLVAILEALKQAGALRAEMEVI